MRRGGDFYYGLDVTNRGAPELLWSLDGTDLPGVGQSWSTPVPTRMNIGRLDAKHACSSSAAATSLTRTMSRPAPTRPATRSTSSTRSMALCSGTAAETACTRISTRQAERWITRSPATSVSIDLDGNGFADRMYAADMGGQVWRFDITNGQPAASLVAGGVIAQLGAAAERRRPRSRTCADSTTRRTSRS